MRGAGGWHKSAAAAAVDFLEKKREAAWLAGRLALLPERWAALAGRDHRRRGGLGNAAANAWLLNVTEAGRGRLSLAASDDDLREAAKSAAREGVDIAALAAKRAGARLRVLLEYHCERWGIAGPGADIDDGPAVKRMLCERWWLRRLRRAHGRRCDGAAICAGVVKRGLWLYATQDGVERRGAQRRRNARAIGRAVVECAATGESLDLAEVVEGSNANPEVKRAELMTRIKGCDAVAAENGDVAEFWTLTTPSRFHSQRIIVEKAVVNPQFSGDSPKEGQKYLSKIWARARAAWKRRGLAVFGLRTAEPHHDATPHWHLICYGPAEDLRLARQLLRRYAMQDCGWEDGAKKHRFTWLPLKGGRGGANYAAKYVSKNIDGKGLAEDIDREGKKKISASVKRVDAWASIWGIRQFQFFGCPAISGWRVLRRFRGPVGVVGSKLEEARRCADDSDFAGYWRAAVAGGLSLIYRAADGLTQYGDAAASKIVGVAEGARRALLPVKVWAIRWGGGGEKIFGGDDKRVYSSGFVDSGVLFDGEAVAVGSGVVSQVVGIGGSSGGVGVGSGGLGKRKMVSPDIARLQAFEVERRWARLFGDGVESEGGMGFGLPRSCVNNCTVPDFEWLKGGFAGGL